MPQDAGEPRFPVQQNISDAIRLYADSKACQDIAVAWQNTPFNPDDETFQPADENAWVYFVVVGGQDSQISLGPPDGRLFRQEGQIEADIFTRARGGTARAERCASDILEALQCREIPVWVDIDSMEAISEESNLADVVNGSLLGIYRIIDQGDELPSTPTRQMTNIGEWSRVDPDIPRPAVEPEQLVVYSRAFVASDGTLLGGWAEPKVYMSVPIENAVYARAASQPDALSPGPMRVPANTSDDPPDGPETLWRNIGVQLEDGGEWSWSGWQRSQAKKLGEVLTFSGRYGGGAVVGQAQTWYNVVVTVPFQYDHIA